MSTEPTQTPKVLITGGAGSLGKEFVRLLHGEMGYQVTVIDSNEWAVAELKAEFPNVTVLLDDIRNLHCAAFFHYVIHAAAYKHIELGESNVMSFIQNNLLSTIDFYKAIAGKYARLLYISTDKAVEPSSAYGMTKSLAEKLTWEIGGQVARSGNFLNSSGSVIPIWEKQIDEGKPLTITDPRMKRFVIEMDDAVKQIWDGFVARKRLIIPDMEEVSLPELIARVLQRKGIKEKDAPKVIVIGKRPGEKMREKLKWKGEKVG